MIKGAQCRYSLSGEGSEEGSGEGSEEGSGEETKGEGGEGSGASNTGEGDADRNKWSERRGQTARNPTCTPTTARND